MRSATPEEIAAQRESWGRGERAMGESVVDRELEIRVLGTYPRVVVEDQQILLKLFDPEKGVDRVLCVLSPVRAHLMSLDLSKAALLGQK
jgi:hypothetical protein